MVNIVYATDDEATYLTRFKLVLQKVGLSTKGFKDFPDSDSFLAQYKIDKEAGGTQPVVFLDINLKGSRLDASVSCARCVSD